MITVRLAMRSSKTLMTTQHQGTKIRFADMNTNTTSDGFTATTDQPSNSDFPKQPMHIGGRDDHWDHTSEAEDNGSNSKYDVPLEDMMRDENVVLECDVVHATTV
jgi:hypothetical protein